MRYNGIPYEAFGPQGEHIRDAREIGELPNEMRAQASEAAAQGIARLLSVEPPARILAGVPVYVAFGMRPADAKRHAHAALLLTLGTHVSLTYCH